MCWPILSDCISVNRCVRRLAAIVLLALLSAVIAVRASESQLATPDSVKARGEYLVYIAGCHACHTDHANQAAFLAGGAGIQTPFGTFYPPNITPDVETGIGGWTEAQFLTAMQHGRAPDGRAYFPAFPYTSYSRMRTADLLAIKHYLDQLTPISQHRRAHQVSGLARWSALLPVWQALNLQPQWSALADDVVVSADAQLQHGAYLVEAVTHCGECHTARNEWGATRYRHWLRGARLPSGRWASNLTPHPDGLAAWDAEELAEYLRTGRTDMGAKARHEMREFVQHAGRYLSDSDRQAIAAYLLALPARADRAPCRQQGPRLRRCQW